MDFSELKVGKNIVMKESICRIIDVALSAPGKHGHAKKKVTGVNLFNGSKYVEIFTHHSHITEATLIRNEYQGIMVEDDNYVVYMDENGEEKQDLLLTQEQADEVAKYDEFIICVTRASYIDDDETIHNFEKIENIKENKE
jgi:translation initiation factor 5A